MSVSNLVFLLQLLIGLNNATVQPQLNWVSDGELFEKLRNDENLTASISEFGNFSTEYLIMILNVAVVDFEKSNPEKVLALCKVSKDILETEYFYAAVLVCPEVRLKSIGREKVFQNGSEGITMVAVQVAAERYTKLVYAFLENWFRDWSRSLTQVEEIETNLQTKFFRRMTVELHCKRKSVLVFLNSSGAATMVANFSDLLGTKTSTEPKTVANIWDVYSAAVTFLENQLALFPDWKTEQEELDEYRHLGAQIVGAAPWIPDKDNMSLYAINTVELKSGHLGVMFQCFGDFPATGLFTAWRVSSTGDKQYTLRHVGKREKIEDAAVTYSRYRKRCELPLVGEAYTKGVEWLSEPGPYLINHVINFRKKLLHGLSTEAQEKYQCARPVRFGLLPSGIDDTATQLQLKVIWELDSTSILVPITLDTADQSVSIGHVEKELTPFGSLSATEFAMHRVHEAVAGTHSAKQSRIDWKSTVLSYGAEALAVINGNGVLPSTVTDFQTCLFWAGESLFKKVKIVKCKVNNTRGYFYVAESKFGVASNLRAVTWYGKIWECGEVETECFRNVVADAETYILDRPYSFQEVWDWKRRSCKVGKHGVVKIETIGEKDIQFRLCVGAGTEAQPAPVVLYGNKHLSFHEALQELESYLNEPLPFVSWSKPTDEEQFESKMAPLLEQLKPEYDLVLTHVKHESNSFLLLLQATGEDGNKYLVSALDDGTKFVAKGEPRQVTNSNLEVTLYPNIMATKPTTFGIGVHWKAETEAESKVDESKLQSVIYAAPWTQNFKKFEIYVRKKSSIPNDLDATAEICYLTDEDIQTKTKTTYWFFIVWIGPRLVHIGGLMLSEDDASLSLARLLLIPLPLKGAVFRNGISWYPTDSTEALAILEIISKTDEFQQGDKANFSLWRIGVTPATSKELEKSLISYCVIVPTKTGQFFSVVTQSKLKQYIYEFNRKVETIRTVSTSIQAEMEILRYITTKYSISRMKGFLSAFV